MGGGAGAWASLPRVVGVAVAILLLGACRADVVVTIDVHASGGGRVRAMVTLDKAAADQATDLVRSLRLEDLEAAGWVVSGPMPADGGGVELELAKGFSSPEEAGVVMEELSGAGGPFSSLGIERRRGLWTTKTALHGTVDLTKGLDAFGDARLTEQLGGPNLGLDPAAVERELGQPVAEAVTVTLVADLPGEEPASWPVALGSKQTVAAMGEQVNTRRLMAVGVAVVSGLALARRVRRRRR